MCQSVESDINGLQKVTDDINITQLQLGTETEALKEELLFLKKNHKVGNKWSTKPDCLLWVDCGIGCPKSQEISKIVSYI